MENLLEVARIGISTKCRRQDTIVAKPQTMETNYFDLYWRFGRSYFYGNHLIKNCQLCCLQKLNSTEIYMLGCVLKGETTTTKNYFEKNLKYLVFYEKMFTLYNGK